MKEKFVQYLETVGLSRTFSDRVEVIHEFFHSICPDEIKGIFVTEYIKEDGIREYESLWFFSDQYCMEAKQFITKDDFDITPLRKHVFYWSIQKQDYDFKEATEKSRLHLKFRLDEGMGGELKASKQNCDYLRGVLLNHFLPNLKT